MKILMIVMSLSLLTACGTATPYRCTSANAEICDLQKRLVHIEDRLSIDRKQVPIVLTDQELINELNRRKRVKTYPTQ